MKKIRIELPKSIDTTSYEVKILVAKGLYKEGKITAQQGADIIGISKNTFVEMIGVRGFSVFGVEYEMERKN